MSASALRSVAPAFDFGAGVTHPAMSRAALLGGCLAAVALAAWVGQGPNAIDADPELARLLRGMAVIKGAIVAAAIGALWWRFGRPMPARTTAVYVLGASMIAGASVLVWQLAFIPAAALVFHIGEFMLLFVAWRDGRGRAAADDGVPAHR